MKKNKPKILMIGSHLINGNQNAWQDLAQKLIKSGYLITTTSPKTDKLSKWVDMTLTLLKRRKEWELIQIDVFSGPAFLWALTSGAFAHWMTIPLVLTLHGGGLPEFSKKYSFLVQWLLNSADVVTAPSGYLVERMKEYRTDIQLITNAIELHLYKYRHRQQVAPKIVWLRAFHEIYNPTLAVRMAEILKQEGIGFQIRMVGPDKGDGSYQRVLALVEQKGLGGSFTFPGGVKKEKVPEELILGDIFLNTTNVDNTPISLMEAMASGLCIVSTNVGGIPYLLEDGVDALLVPPDDPQAMADAIRRIISEPGLAGRLSANARRKAESFDWSVVLPQWEVLLERYPK